MPAPLEAARIEDAAAIAALLTTVAEGLTRQYGTGHWSHASTKKAVLSGMKRSRVYVARNDAGIVATLTLATKKPWAIDRRYFSDVKRPLCLLGMAVGPGQRGGGIGKQCIFAAKVICREWPADALFLDAYDDAAGAGEFYRKWVHGGWTGNLPEHPADLFRHAGVSAVHRGTATG